MSLTPDPTSAVLQAARLAFASRGYASTTVKGIAAAAGVAPDVVTSLYRNKERLFAAALRLPFDPAQAVPELIAPGLDGMGDRIVRITLTLMGDEQVRRDLNRLLAPQVQIPANAARAVVPSQPVDQLRLLSEYLSSTVLDRVVTAIGLPDARMRVSVISAYLMGIAASRYILKLEPLASASDDEVVRLVGPAIQVLLDPTRKPTAP